MERRSPSDILAGSGPLPRYQRWQGSQAGNTQGEEPCSYRTPGSRQFSTAQRQLPRSPFPFPANPARSTQSDQSHGSLSGLHHLPMFTRGQAFVDRGVQEYENGRAQRELAALQFKAAAHGFRLVKVQTLPDAFMSRNFERTQSS